MATVTGMTAEKINELIDGRVPASSVEVEATVEDLDTGDGAFGSLALGRAYRLIKVEVDKPCRLRLYASTEQRTADGDRNRDEDPQGDHGVILEVIMTDEILSMNLLPAPHGYTDVVSGTTPFSIVNDGDDGDITITFLEQVLEPA